MPESESENPNIQDGVRPTRINISTIELTERPTEAAHTLLRERVKSGDHVVDATLGNGHDTLFLSALVGSTGQVDGFDIQREAIEATRQKLQGQSAEHLTLHQVGHENMASLVKAPVQAVMFNLGYLPGGNKQVITQAKTTTAALQAAVGLLSPGGILTIVVYTGHPGGQKEANAVTLFCQSLDPQQFAITIYKSAAAKTTAPFLVTVIR